MHDASSGLSRRRFLSGTIAAAGGLSVDLLARRAGAQVPTPALPLDRLAPSSGLDEAYWWKVRSQFNVVDGLTFMNNGTLGPVPRVVADANARYFQEIAEDPTNGYRREEVDAVREQMAAFVGADPDEIAITRSTTEGMNIFAHGLDWEPGDEVLVNSHEHGGGLGPYQTLAERRGIRIVTIDLPSPPSSIDEIVGRYERAMTAKTRVLMVSHMTYVTGLIAPVKELADLAHRRNALISVDGAHPLGMLPLDMRALGCDHYSGAGQKWLLAGTGTGVCYVRRDIQERVWPLMGHPNEERPGARKYEEFGQRDVPSALGMGAALDFQRAIGPAVIEDRVRALADRLRRGLADIPGVRLWTSNYPALAAGLTLFSVRDIPMDNVQRAISERDRVYVRTMSTGDLNAVRASTHIYNMPEEVDRLLDSVRHLSEHASQYMSTAA